MNSHLPLSMPLTGEASLHPIVLWQPGCFTCKEMESSSYKQKTANGKRSDYVVFALKPSAFAVPASTVREIVWHAKLQAPSRSRKGSFGTFKLKDKTIQILDIHSALGIPPSVAKTDCIVVVEVGAMVKRSLLGLPASGIKGVLNIPAEEISSPSIHRSGTPEWVSGKVKCYDMVGIILNPKNMLESGGF